jgi:sigma-B regulation protein RsbQ
MNNEVSRASTIIKRHAITEFGAPDAPAIVFAHGYGTSQQMWRLVAPAFAERHRVVLFDHVGSGMSDRSSYSTERYDTLEGYASDLLEIIAELELRDVTYVGHSVSAMIGVIAAVREPSAISRLVMLGASPRYINDGDYVGGFDAADVDALLEAIEANYLGWAVAMAPTFVGDPDHPEIVTELTESFMKADPAIAKHFARVTFRTDVRDRLGEVPVPSLILHSVDDAVAPREVGDYLAARIPGSRRVWLDTAGHYAHLANPDEIKQRVREFIE